MSKQKKTLSRIVSAAVLAVVLVFQIVPISSVFAAQIGTSRSLTLKSHTAISDGGSKPSGVVDHQFDFPIPSGTNIGSIEFKYCTLAAGVPDPDTCVTPTGLVTTAAAIDSQSGAATGFTMVNTTAGAPYLTRTAASVTPGVEQIILSGVTNPSTPNETFYVRISTFISENATGAKTDTGTVAASTARQIILSGIMPESLVFCVAETIGLTAGLVPDCATATDGTVAFNQLFSSTATATASSQMAASTNATNGYVISANGPTLTSGSNTIARMVGSPLGTAPLVGVSQFGLNAVANAGTAPYYAAFGLNLSAVSDGDTLRGQAMPNYSVADMFKYQSGETIANSGNAVLGHSDSQIFTVSYIANVPGSQPAGTYLTTLTYICTPTF